MSPKVHVGSSVYTQSLAKRSTCVQPCRQREVVSAEADG